MKNNLLLLSVKLQNFLTREEGQDLIEYALIAAFLAVASAALMPGIANSISVVFSKVASAVDEASETGS